MGMFDEKRYLTGKNGVVGAGDVFHLHGAGIAGTVRRQGTGEQTPEAFLMVSKSGTEDPLRVFTTGVAIAGQVARMDRDDAQRMASPGGMVVRLGEVATPNGVAFILEDPSTDAEDSTPVPGQTPGQPL